MRHLHVCSLCLARKSHPQGLLSTSQGCGKTTQSRLGGCHAETPDLPELTPQTTLSLTSLKAPLERQLLRVAGIRPRSRLDRGQWLARSLLRIRYGFPQRPLCY